MIQFYEDPELEVARLAAAPEGSQSHALSKLPVNIEGHLADLLIELPHLDTEIPHTMVVVPFRRNRGEGEDGPLPHRRHNGSWACIVVASDHPNYRAGGHRLDISEAELVRGTIRPLELATSPAAPTQEV